MLVYFTILSVVATGVYTLAIYSKPTADYQHGGVTEQADEASAFLVPM